MASVWPASAPCRTSAAPGPGRAGPAGRRKGPRDGHGTGVAGGGGARPPAAPGQVGRVPPVGKKVPQIGHGVGAARLGGASPPVRRLTRSGRSRSANRIPRLFMASVWPAWAARRTRLCLGRSGGSRRSVNKIPRLIMASVWPAGAARCTTSAVPVEVGRIPQGSEQYPEIDHGVGVAGVGGFDPRVLCLIKIGHVGQDGEPICATDHGVWMTGRWRLGPPALCLVELGVGRIHVVSVGRVREHMSAGTLYCVLLTGGTPVVGAVVCVWRPGIHDPTAGLPSCRCGRSLAR